MTEAQSKIKVQHSEVSVIRRDGSDFFSLTDIAKYKNPNEPFSVINNWLRSRSTIEFVGLWEKLNNSNFKPIEFERFRSEADLLNVALFGITAKDWRDSQTTKFGNIRDHATLEQLVVLSNMESINALLIHQGQTQTDRLIQLNKVAITQMKSLVEHKVVEKFKTIRKVK